MGELIELGERREARRARLERQEDTSRAEFSFDLACPFTYLAAERVDRAFPSVSWSPASTTALRCGSLASEPGALDALRATAEARALALRLPLVWPERWPADVPAAMRVAHYAAQEGRGGAFVLAAARLAFAGGFDLDDPEILTEAAAAAGVGLDACLRAAKEVRRDGAIEAAGKRLLAAGVDQLPALSVGDDLCWGEGRIAEAAALARARAAAASP
jgi:2-hydroxychromene-2-carboxylate isomerase